MNFSISQKKKIFFRINKILHRLFPKIETALSHKNLWELLVATILSAQTTDKKVNEITASLFKKYKTIDAFSRISPAELAKDIYGVNYHITKARAIVENAKIIKKKFQGKVPRTMAEMLILRGVARKTANIVLSSGYGIIEGIAVDTHVKRLAPLLGLTTERDPKRIEKDLMEIIPKGKEWKEFPLRLVAYGRKYCPARSHPHARCPIVDSAPRRIVVK